MARILLADDDQNARDFVGRALETAGHTVVVADDGVDALAKLSSNGPFEILLTDVQMPALDGIALTHQAIAADPRIRVLMMSGYPDVLERARSTAKGAVHFLSKPFTIDTIRTAVAAALKG